jgi:pyruvate dehydrogenase E2 component (dihydrolipoamide acetyltransferase)
LSTNVIMPALEMAQDKGKLLRWLKSEGSLVTQGEPIMEIETDKVTVEIEAPATGTLANVTAHEGDVVPVGQTIALILAAGESASKPGLAVRSSTPVPKPAEINVSPVARKVAEEHGVDLVAIKPGGGRIEKADVLAYLVSPITPAPLPSPDVPPGEGRGGWGSRVRSSPKAKRLAQERGVDIAMLRGTGPGGAVLAEDVPSTSTSAVQPPTSNFQSPISTVWRVMAERMTQSWTTVPHFYLVRDVDASKLVELRTRLVPMIEKKTGVKPTFTDVLVKIVAMALRDHPRVNASWLGDRIQTNEQINVGIATAIDDGLIVPVVHNADTLTIGEIATRRKDIVERAGANKLKPADISGGTFTITNLGMYNVDQFNAIINTPQAAILAVGRIADRVVAVNGQPTVRPMMTLSLSSDHRVVDGARAAKFLDALANLIEEPLGLLA